MDYRINKLYSAQNQTDPLRLNHIPNRLFPVFATAPAVQFDRDLHAFAVLRLLVES
jgi:hypothetical protein